MSLLQQVNVFWQKIGVVQRALLVAIVLACLTTGGLLTKWATAPDMVLLYGDLALEEVDEIVSKLREQDVRWDLRQGGRSIYVPAEKVLELRAALAGEGLPRGGEMGYKLFDNEKIGISPVVQRMNFIRAQQDELAKTIQALDGIVSARVHIVRPEETIFTDGSRQASASVSLRLRPGWRISPATVAAIVNLVAGATEGLTQENITVIDTQGRLLSSATTSNSSIQGANTFLDYKRRVESEIASEVQEMLELVLGPGRASVKISATVDMTSETVQTTKYEKGEPVEETINTTSTIKPATVAADGTEKSAGSTDKQETIESTYKVPETITKTIEMPGEIVSLSVAAVVDLSAAASPESADNGETAGTATPKKIMSITDVEEIIRNAVGADLLKSPQSLTVKDVAFYRPAVTPDGADTGYEKLSRYIEIARHGSMGILAICALLALKIFAGARKKVAAETAALAPAPAQMESWSLLGPGQAEADAQAAFRRQIAGSLQRDPEQVRQLFTTWLTEDR